MRCVYRLEENVAFMTLLNYRRCVAKAEWQMRRKERRLVLFIQSSKMLSLGAATNPAQILLLILLL